MKPSIAGAQENNEKNWWQRAKENVADIAAKGDPDLYLSGYAYHNRSNYTPEKLAEFNETIWGAGFGKSIRNAKGNDESLYMMLVSDSHQEPQLMAGYAYQWMWAPGSGRFKVGAGATLGLVSRTDYFHNFPFPIVLPVATVGSQRVKALFSYVPRLSKNRGNGEVLLFFLRIGLPD